MATRRLRQLPIRIGATMQQTTSGGLVLSLQKELESPNKTLWAHWRVKQRKAKAWRELIVRAVVDGMGYSAALALLTAESGLYGAHGGLVCACPTEKCQCPRSMRRRVSIVRAVPSSRHFIRDEDNLAFAAKHLVDSLTRLGLLRDDDRKWCERRTPEQIVSKDGTFWTYVTIERIAEEKTDAA